MIVALAMLLWQPQEVEIRAGDPRPTTWPILGKTDLAQGATLRVAARRVERSWDARTSRFIAHLSECSRLRASARVEQGAFTGNLKPGVAGVYEVTVAAAKDKVLVTRRLALGGMDGLLTSSRDEVDRLVKVAGRAAGFLDELERIAESNRAPTDKMREDFLSRTGRDDAWLEKVAREFDLTATTALLRSVLYHLRNCQLWAAGARTGAAENDGETDQRGYFLDPALTLGDLRKTIESVRRVLSQEIRVSIAAILNEVIGQNPAARVGTARLGTKLAAAAPEADDAFARLLQDVERGNDADAAREQLRRFLHELVKDR